jgi:hypothetical protein
LARPCLKKLFTKIGLVEWLKVKALSLSPSTTKKKKREKMCKMCVIELGKLAYACIPSTPKTQAEDLKFKTILGYVVTPCLTTDVQNVCVSP